MNADARPLTVPDLLAMKAAGRRIVMLTCYDAAFARLLEQAEVDVLLVGDSVNQVLAGQETTLSATLDQMIYHAASVRRGARRALVFVDLPFLTYQVSVAEAIRNAGRVLQESGAHGVKLEGGRPMAETVRALVDRGIPVIGHLGLTPQSVHALGGYRVQGRDAAPAERLLADAAALEEAGACARRARAAARGARAADHGSRSPFRRSASAPGAGCDGQVLVLHDMLGLNEKFNPKFLKRYAELGEAVRDGGPVLRRRGARRYATRRQSTASIDSFLPPPSMIELETIPDLRRWVRDERAAGRRIALVPTMGYLHEGHLRLVDEARRRADRGRHEHLREPAAVRAARGSRALPARPAARPRPGRGARRRRAVRADRRGHVPAGLRDPRRARRDRRTAGRARRGPATSRAC